MDRLIPIGSNVVLNGWCGKVAAVGLISGERYYWLIQKDGTVSMVPSVALVGVDPQE